MKLNEPQEIGKRQSGFGASLEISRERSHWEALANRERHIV